MNIQLKHIDGQWVVVVSSIAGQFKQVVTDQVMLIVESEVAAKAVALSSEINAVNAEKAATLDAILELTGPYTIARA